AALLLVIFGGDPHALIPLYAVGVFLSFTLSQASMVRRWLRRKEEGWWWRWWFNALGAIVTGLVMLTIAATKFTHGAWIVVLLIPTLVAVFALVHRHYEEVAVQLSLDGLGQPAPMTTTVLVLVGDLHRGVIKAIQYAQALSPNAKAVFVETDPERTRKLEEKWRKMGMGVPLIVLTSPYRSLLGPLLEYIDHLQTDRSTPARRSRATTCGEKIPRTASRTAPCCVCSGTTAGSCPTRSVRPARWTTRVS